MPKELGIPATHSIGIDPVIANLIATSSSDGNTARIPGLNVTTGPVLDETNKRWNYLTIEGACCDQLATLTPSRDATRQLDCANCGPHAATSRFIERYRTGFLMATGITIS